MYHYTFGYDIDKICSQTDGNVMNILHLPESYVEISFPNLPKKFGFNLNGMEYHEALALFAKSVNDSIDGMIAHLNNCRVAF